MSVEIRRASDRFVDREPGRATWHGFSFGEHYDPARTSFGPMVAHDEHLLGEGRGFGDHDHRDVVVVTWVVTGALHHTDSTGTDTVLAPGTVAVLDTGSGVTHAEVAAAPQTRFVQCWLRRDPTGLTGPASYAATTSTLDPGRLCPVTEPLPGATLSVVRLAAWDMVVVPPAPLVHVFVASGALQRSSLAEPLHPGDAFLVTASGPGPDGEAPAEPPYELVAAVPTELLVWTFA